MARDLNTLRRISPDLSNVYVEVPYQGLTFTVVKATLTLPKSGRPLIGEGISRRSFVDRQNGDTGFNIAVRRALEALDKKLGGQMDLLVIGLKVKQICFTLSCPSLFKDKCRSSRRMVWME